MRALNDARQTVFVQAYSFTSHDIAAALLHARQRGVVVHVILDHSVLEDHYSEADFLAHGGISVLIDAKHPIAHNKVMIIDGQTVITGSFNFTRQAEEHNAENLLVIHDRTLAEHTWRTGTTTRPTANPTPATANKANGPGTTANIARRGRWASWKIRAAAKNVNG